ncbi:Peroxidase 64 [Ananas comosus]|uniref:Peroxidase n=1 Tax=Ananas comosus TaxID=4615 RepID=A0A199VL88_ANACO|nr:Peroxidase 64 [Ananas comosus]
MAALIASFLLAFSLLLVGVNALMVDYYAETCPGVEEAVEEAVKKATANDNTVPAALLRMHFHDCFIRGCDGSVLVDSQGNNTAEKDGPPNISLHAFYVIDNAKKAVEELCPGVVSCADILALAARDAVAISGGPIWEVPTGRKDGKISRASDTSQLPAPTFNFSQLKQSFSQRGGHTLGFAHCSSFQNRIHNFDATDDVDPSMNPAFADSLRKACPAHNKVRSAGSAMDSTNTVFDNTYYKLLLQGKGLFSSDEALLTHRKTMELVARFADSQKAFERAFVKAMIRMSSLTGGDGVRLDCRVVT